MEQNQQLLEQIQQKFLLKQMPAKEYSPLVLAYIGDGIYDMIVRTIFVSYGNTQVDKLNKQASNVCRASSQAAIAFAIAPLLTEEETSAYRRGRNARSFTKAKNATMSDYRHATGLEAMVRWSVCLIFFQRALCAQVCCASKHLKKRSCIRKKKGRRNKENMGYHESLTEGRNAVLEAFRSGKTVDRLFVLDGCQDGPVKTILREAKKQDTMVQYVKKERLDQLSETKNHQGVIAYCAACEYAEVSDILENAKKKGEAPFIVLLDGIEDPHNLGAIIRTANQAGAHGVIIPKRRAVGLTATVARTSAGAVNYTPVAKVTNLVTVMEDLKKEGMWFVCADMDGEEMYSLNLKGPIGLVIGNEGEGVSRLVKEHCDMVASIPMKGDIDSLNASVAMGVLAYEIVRQRRF